MAWAARPCAYTKGLVRSCQRLFGSALEREHFDLRVRVDADLAGDRHEQGEPAVFGGRPGEKSAGAGLRPDHEHAGLSLVRRAHLASLPVS